MKSSIPILSAVLALAVSTAFASGSDDYDDDDNRITIIHTGDFHGHLTPRPNLRSNSDGRMVGGLARIATKIKEITKRNDDDNVLVMHTGDTIQGSGEALYTRGKAIVDVVDMLGIDAYAPGNWDFVYGPERFKELFATPLSSKSSKTRWGGLVANLYNYDPAAPKNPTAKTSEQGTNYTAAEYAAWADWYVANGQSVLKPYRVTKVNGVKIGIVGCTTSRGPQVVGSGVTKGLEFTDCSREVPKFAEAARAEGAKFVVLISEIEIGRNIRILKDNITNANQHVDLVLNSDMHEEVLKPIEVLNNATGKTTWIIESGMDGTLVGEINLTVKDGQVTGMTHTAHVINDTIKEDEDVAEKVAKVRKPYNEGFTASIPCDSKSPYWNSFTESTCLTGPLSEVVGNTQVGLHRSNYTHDDMPASIEGSSHDFIADAIRWWSQSDLATVRGFRYGTHVKPGPITRNDLFHFVPIGPRVGKASRVVPNQIRNQIDNSSLAVFSSDPNSSITPLPRYNNNYGDSTKPEWGTSPGAGLPAYGTAGNSLGWGGGWLFAYSAEGFHMDFAPYFTPNWQTVRSGAPGSAGSGYYLETDPATGKSYNIQVTAAATDTSRARSFTVSMPCKYLPPAEQVAKICDVNDLTTRHSTTLTTVADGKWTPNWGNTLTSQGSAAKQVYMLVLDNEDTSDTQSGWQYLQGLANQPNSPNAAARPFQLPTFTVAGYFYHKSPNTINNCNNCLATGLGNNLDARTATGELDLAKIADTAYLLPVNADANGSPALDANGNPIYVRDGSGNVMWETDANGFRKPKIEGKPIDLTVIIEKYLAHLENEDGGVTAGNLPLNRIGLVNNDGTGPISLPDFSATLGFPVMQPFCGSIGKDATTILACPQ